MLLLKISIFLLLISIGQSHAKVVEPFSIFGNQISPSDYKKLINKENIIKGDIISISNTGEKFLVNGFLGEGATTIIFDVSDMSDPSQKSYALRLAKYNGDYSSSHTFATYLDTYAKGYDQLKKFNINLPKIIKSQRSQYILVEKLGDHFTLKNFLKNHLFFENQKKSDLILKGFSKFIKDTVDISHIGDMHLNQIVYNIKDKKWMLLDWSNGIMHRTSFERESHFLKMALTNFLTVKKSDTTIDSSITLLKKIIDEESKKAAKIESVFLKNLTPNISNINSLNDLDIFLNSLPKKLSSKNMNLIEEALLDHIKESRFSINEINNSTSINLYKKHPLMNKTIDALKVKAFNSSCKEIFNKFFKI